MGRLLNLSIVTFRTNTPPATPIDAEYHIVGPAPDGLWVGFVPDTLTFWDAQNAVWQQTFTTEGDCFFDMQKQRTLLRIGIGWRKRDNFAEFWSGLAGDQTVTTTLADLAGASGWSTPVVIDGVTGGPGWTFNIATGILTAEEAMERARVGFTARVQGVTTPTTDCIVSLYRGGVLVPNMAGGASTSSAVAVNVYVATATATVKTIAAGETFRIKVQTIVGTSTDNKIEADGTAFFATELPGDFI